jgi:hypothetical protein
MEILELENTITKIKSSMYGSSAEWKEQRKKSVTEQ